MLLIYSFLVLVAIMYILIVIRVIRRRKYWWLKEGLESIPATSTTSGNLTYTSPASNVGDNLKTDVIINANNVAYLKQELDKLSALKGQVDENSKAIAGLGSQLQKASTAVTSRPADATEPVPVISNK